MMNYENDTWWDMIKYSDMIYDEIWKSTVIHNKIWYVIRYNMEKYDDKLRSVKHR